MKAKKGLQKFTDSETKINEVLSLKRITRDDVGLLSENEKDALCLIISENLNNLKGEEMDKFVVQIEGVLDQNTKNQLWGNNHNLILGTISNLMIDFGRMPNTTEIAHKTQLSRQTIHKHLKEYANHPLHHEQIEQFSFLKSRVLAKVFDYAIHGDMTAAKLYFNIVGGMNNGQAQSNTHIQNQNNYIQINGTVLKQEAIKYLNPEQLNAIETIMKTAVPQPEILEITTSTN